MASNGSQKGKNLVRVERAEPVTYKVDSSQTVTIGGWEFVDPAATAKPTPAAPGTHLSRTQRRWRSKKHFKKKAAEEERHLEELANLTRGEVSKRPYKDLVQWWNLEDGEDPTAKPVKKLQVPKRVQESEDK